MKRRVSFIKTAKRVSNTELGDMNGQAKEATSGGKVIQKMEHTNTDKKILRRQSVILYTAISSYQVLISQTHGPCIQAGRQAGLYCRLAEKLECDHEVNGMNA